MEIDYRFKIAQVPLWRLLELEAIMKERSGETMIDYIRSKENTKGFSRLAELERRASCKEKVIDFSYQDNNTQRI